MGSRKRRWRFLTYAGLGVWCALACGGRVTGSTHEGIAHGGLPGLGSTGGSAGGGIDSTGSVASGASNASAAGAGVSNATAGSAGAHTSGNAGNAGKNTANGIAGSTSAGICPNNVGGVAIGQCPDIAPVWPDCCKVGDFQPTDASPGGTSSASAPERLTPLADSAEIANAVRAEAKSSVLRQYAAYWNLLRADHCASIPTHHATADVNSVCVADEDPPPGSTSDPPPLNLPDPAPGPDSSGAQRGTNYAVAGVATPDRWQFDDRYLYVLTSTGLMILDVRDASNTVVLSRLPLEGTAKGLLVVADRALVIAAAEAKSLAHCSGPYDCQFWGDGHMTSLSVIDITDRKNPRLTRLVQLSGSYIGGGMVGSNAQIVTADGLAEPTISWSEPNVGVTSTATEAMALLMAQYQAAIASLTTANVGLSAPSAQETSVLDDGSTRPPSAVNPNGVYWSRGMPSSAVSVTSFDVGVQAEIRQQLVYTRPGAVQMTPDLLWLAVPEYLDDSTQPGPDTTWIHGFAWSGASARYRGSGRIDGHVSNRFTLDQYQGDFRIATTTGEASYQQVPAQSTLAVLGWKGDQLSLSSEVNRIAPGKYLRAVHFAGTRAYATVVDSPAVPVFDLSIAAAAKTLGEFNLSGTTTYVHALDERRVLTIGNVPLPITDGYLSFSGVTMQALDLSDPAKPVLLSGATIDTLGSITPNYATFTEPLSLRYFEGQRLLAMPMTICESSANGRFADVPTFTGLMLYELSADLALTPRGRVSYPVPSGYYDNSAEPACSKWWPAAESPVSRSAVVGNHIFGLSSAMLEISSLTNPARILASYVVGAAPCDELDESTCAANLRCLPIRGLRLTSGREEYLGCASTRTGWPGSSCTKSTNCATSFSALDCATVQSSCVPIGWGKLGAASCTAALCGG